MGISIEELERVRPRSASDDRDVLLPGSWQAFAPVRAGFTDHHGYHYRIAPGPPPAARSGH